ncbi:MAG TPA: SCO family protein [Alphaproteobacteria bacterium]|nr:SCO family protein [Alphaproteobacteria bacterium]
MRVFWVVGIVVAGVLVGLGVRLYREGADSLNFIASGSALVGGPFTLVDQDGKPRTDAEFRGSLMLVYFGYTYCPDVCPTELQTMSDALDALGDKAAKVQPIFITVDPERDTPPVVKDYVSHFHPRFIALTGTPSQVDAAEKAYRVYAAKAPSKSGGNDYLMDHTGLVYLMGRNGKYLTSFTPQTTPQQMAQAIAQRL